MTHRIDVARGRDIVARWCTLAEQRLQYLTELFETGRWRRFHSERAFLENIQEAKRAVETWRDLLSRETIPGDSVVNLSSSIRAGATVLGGERLRDQIGGTQPVSIAKELPGVSIAPKAALVCSDEAPSAPAPEASIPDRFPELTLGAASIEQRYPLLRNTM